MQRMILWIATGVLVAFSATAAAELTPHRAEYKVKISVLSGKLTTALTRDGDRFVATHLVKPTGLAGGFVGGEIFAESEFQEGSDGLLPMRYSANDEISSEKLRTDIAFDWDARRATGTFQTRDDPEPRPVDEELVDDAHDGVSIQYELMKDLMNSGPNTEYVLFEHDRQRQLNIDTVGTQTVKTRAGEFETIGIRHQAEGSSRATTLWCAPELGYLPVMIERHRKGKLQMRAQLVSYEPDQT